MYYHTIEVYNLETIIILQVAGDERRKSTDSGVDTGLARQSTAITERHHTKKYLGRTDDRASAVTLARILSSSGETSAEHTICDRRSRVVVAAGSA
jgi:hypothetical protein